MSTAVRLLSYAAGLIVIACAIAWLSLPSLTDRQVSGQRELSVLEGSVRVLRDDLGVPYIYADSLEDALRAQGFIAGQDRLFQMEAAKRAATGRLAEVFGAGPDDVILNLDRESRVIGFRRHAERQRDLLAPAARAQLITYLEGLNAYIADSQSKHPLEFQLAGFAPEPWTETDLLAVAFFLGWGSAANFDAELIALQVIEAVGEDRFREIAPLTVNPDSPAASSSDVLSAGETAYRGRAAHIAAVAPWVHKGWRQVGLGGSNNWAVSGAKANQSAAIVTNDPHLDSRALPGPWHPVGLITPTMRVVGVSAGLPGVVIGRNEHVAFGVTNAYADAIDLYVETLDPNDSNRYLEGDQSLPLTVRTEVINIKYPEADSGIRQDVLTVRSTRRGPLISDHSSISESDAVLSVRWASTEYMGDALGLDMLMTATTVEEALSASRKPVLSPSTSWWVMFRVVLRGVPAVLPLCASKAMACCRLSSQVARTTGQAAFRPRKCRARSIPLAGWTGTANHQTAPADYPWVYTTYASPNYRYRRLQELMSPAVISAEQAWQGQYDDLNVFARDLSPILVQSLAASTDPALQALGDLLAKWDHRDDASLLAPTVFHEIIRQLARATFEDELGERAVEAYLSSWYVWQQRFDTLMQSGNSIWFDDQRTEEVETLPELIERAASAAFARLERDYGVDRSNWTWGKVHRIQFSGPLRLNGVAGDLTGNRTVAMSGSGETLLRALYPFDQPFDSKWFASLRMTADLNDPDKVRAVLPGGAVGRTFNPHLADQTSLWLDPDNVTYWWFSDSAIEANAVSELTLTPTR